jgi:polyisoprenoid-binding protein YceI
MKKLIVTMVLTASVLLVNAQEKYFTRSGVISFFSKTDMENIDARNTKATSILDTKTGQMEFAVLMKAFEFKKELMMEHFNENYVESDKFPKATFKGSVTNIETVNFSKDGIYPIKIKGQLTMHGVTNEVVTDGKFEVKEGVVQGSCSFICVLADYKIAIPSVVKDNISKTIKIDVEVTYEKLKI